MGGNYKSDQMATAAVYGWHVYVLSEEGDFYSKIGTASRPKYRIDGLQNGNPRKLRQVAVWHLSSREDAFKLELDALVRVGTNRLHGRDWVKCHYKSAIRAVDVSIKTLHLLAKRLPQ